LSWLEEHEVSALVDRKWFVECDIVNALVGVNKAANRIVSSEGIIVEDFMESDGEFDAWSTVEIAIKQLGS